ncbi:hypothetical protein GDO86_002715 [Hymenochirus boettgeri]|uniref:Uncharacterized protein n=1 Tax=Hymenochirus boettgeri TaxID=247094 RepID=A0A8T2K6B8_9PIPI|nr:hypothetical protein GDO86_002715 [Hymenochirus boettgeri]
MCSRHDTGLYVRSTMHQNLLEIRHLKSTGTFSCLGCCITIYSGSLPIEIISLTLQEVTGACRYTDFQPWIGIIY